MTLRRVLHLSGFLQILILLTPLYAGERETPGPWPGDSWRREHRIIDLHQHIDGTEAHVAQAVRILDRAGIGIGVNLSGGTVTANPGEKSEFERVRDLADRGRFQSW